MKVLCKTVKDKLCDGAIIIISGCTITSPNYGKADFSQLIRIYNADAVNSK